MGGVKKSRYRQMTAACLLALFLIFFCSLCIGRYTISLSGCIRILAGREMGQTAQNVIFSLRLPRTLASMLVGMALSAAGTVFQSTFCNKLVSPDILGVTSGACVGAASAILLGLSARTVSIAAFSSGVLAVCITLLVARAIRNRSSIVLVLSGVIVSSLMNSILGLLKFIADPNRQLAEITYWMMGSLAGVALSDVIAVLPFILLPLLLLLLLRWRLNVLALGELQASSLGMNYQLMRLTMIGCGTLLTAAAVCISGSISWVGLVVPHFSRMLVGEDRMRALPLSILLGGNFMILADLLARTLSMNEIPLSIITGFIGTVVYIGLLVKRGCDIQ